MTQKEALDILKMGSNVYLTGAAGSGKTYVLNQHIEYLNHWGVRVAITAPTGIAATHMGGVTIHSWAGIGISHTLSNEEIKRLRGRSEMRERFQETSLLIIDEISMLDAKRLDLVDHIARYLRGNSEPFGGMQVVLCGDFFQLPPVAKTGEPMPEFAYKSRAWETMQLRVCYLHEQYRQTDAEYLSLLNAIRSGNAAVDENTLRILRKRLRASVPNVPRLTKLYTHNVDVDTINARELTKLVGGSLRFMMEEKGIRSFVEELKRGCLAPEELVLKKDAFVMFVRNNFEKGYVNGTLGTVTDFDDSGFPVVTTLKKRVVIASPERWAILREGRVIAEITQVPLRLAWAITIHKSQGMTLDAAQVDLSGAFVPGMGYVALSRIPTLSSLRLMGWKKEALRISLEVLARDQALLRRSQETREELGAMAPEVIQERQRAFLLACGAPENLERRDRES